MDRWRVSLFGDRLHVIIDDDVEQGRRTGRSATLAREGIRVLRAREARFSLEDVFISVVEQARRQGKVAADDAGASSMSRIMAQARKELMQLVRDRLALALALVLPLMQLTLMGTVVLASSCATCRSWCRTSTTRRPRAS